MPLSCSIWDFNDNGDSWYFYPPEDYLTYNKPRRKSCSCGSMISHGTLCAKFLRFRSARSFIEERIRGHEVVLADMYLCERCADLYFSFQDLGFVAVCPNENMLELAREYRAIYQSHKA